MADGTQPRDEAGRFASTKTEPPQREHPCERLARTFNPPPAVVAAAEREAATGSWMRKRIGSDDDGRGRTAELTPLLERVGWRHQFDDAMAVGLAGVATGIPPDLLLARWAGQDHRGMACRLVFARLERMGLSARHHAARIAVAWVVESALAPPPKSPNERQRTAKQRALPITSFADARRQARIREDVFRLLTRLARAILGDMLRELERAYCTARYAGF